MKYLRRLFCWLGCHKWYLYGSCNQRCRCEWCGVKYLDQSRRDWKEYKVSVKKDKDGVIATHKGGYRE